MFILRDSNLLLLILSCTTTLILMAVRHSISPTNSSGKIVVTKFQPSYPFRDFLMNPATPEIPMHLFMPMRDPKVCAEIFLAMMYNPSGDVILGPFQSLIQKYSNETIIITDAKPDICFFSPHEGGVFIPYLFLKDGWRLRYNSKFVEWVEKRIALSGKSNDILASSALALHVFPLKARSSRFIDAEENSVNILTVTIFLPVSDQWYWAPFGPFHTSSLGDDTWTAGVVECSGEPKVAKVIRCPDDGCEWMTAILGDNLVRTAPLELPESYKSIQTCQVPVYPTLMALTGSRSKTSRVLYETFAQIQYNVAVKRTTGYWIKFSDMGGLVSARMDWSNALILPVVQVMLVGIILASAVFVARDKEHYNSRFQATLSSYIARSSLTKICLFQAIIFMFMYDEVLSGVFFGGSIFIYL